MMALGKLLRGQTADEDRRKLPLARFEYAEHVNYVATVVRRPQLGEAQNGLRGGPELGECDPAIVSEELGSLPECRFKGGEGGRLSAPDRRFLGREGCGRWDKRAQECQA